MSSRPPLKLLNYHGVPIWRNVVFIRLVMQALAALFVISIIWLLATNLMNNAEQRGLNLSFKLLSTNAGFDVPYSLIPFDSSKSILYAFFAGVANTLRLVGIAIFTTTILGVLIGLAQLSSNFVISGLGRVYVQTLRNIPLITFAFFLFFGLLRGLPKTSEAWHMPGIGVMSNRGIYLTSVDESSSLVLWLIIVALGIVAAYLLNRMFLKNQGELKLFGIRLNRGFTPIVLLLLVAAIGWIAQPQAPFVFDQPELKGTNFVGGMKLTTEFFAILTALTVYIASYVAEIVRGSVQSVPKGQVEAAEALGLNYWQVTLNVVLPQAARIAVLPMIGQWVNLTKGSALAIVVGYAEVFVVARTAIEKTGMALQIFVMVIAFYMIMGAFFSLLGNWYNRKVQFDGR
jgi:general L-amino acid transport system permease protein